MLILESLFAEADHIVLVVTHLQANFCKHCFLFLQTFQDQGISNYLVCYLRIIAAGYLQKNADFYLPFLNGYADMKDFCSRVSVRDLHT